MKAMVITRTGRVEDAPLELHDVPLPVPGAGEILIKVSACGVCHTELDEIEGRTPPPKLPVVPGHQVVGSVVSAAESPEGDSPRDSASVTELVSRGFTRPAASARTAATDKRISAPSSLLRAGTRMAATPSL